MAFWGGLLMVWQMGTMVFRQSKTRPLRTLALTSALALGAGYAAYAYCGAGCASACPGYNKAQAAAPAVDYSGESIEKKTPCGGADWSD
jgi:hypothetical protein